MTPVTNKSHSVTKDLKTIKEKEGNSNSVSRDCKRLSIQSNSVLACATMTSQIPVLYKFLQSPFHISKEAFWLARI